MDVSTAEPVDDEAHREDVEELRGSTHGALSS
jgi:hypothetical protein